jgi:thiopurine S-methyltransferase
MRRLLSTAFRRGSLTPLTETGARRMEADYWHGKWDKDDIGFHEGTPNRLLTRHLHTLSLEPGARVFLPLCGKTRDIAWLLENGFRVAGAELSEKAIRALFDDLGPTPSVTEVGPVKHFAAEDIDIFVGDIFDLTARTLGPVDAVYDRAALVALPDPLRARYARHLRDLTHAAPQLLLCFEYDQADMNGPPFSITPDEVARHYAETHAVSLAESVEVPGKLKGLVVAMESAWHLRPL